MNKIKRLTLLTLALSPWLLSACSSTQLVNHWSDARFTSQPLHHVVVYSKNKDPGIARSVEIDVTKRLSEVTHATPAYEIFGDKDLATVPKAEIKAVLLKHNIDGFVVTEVSDITYTEKHVPAEYSRGFWSDGWGGYYVGNTLVSPGYNYVSTNLYAQGALYAVADGQLVWSAQTKSTDPGNLGDMRQDILNLFTDNLMKAKVLAK